MTAAYCSNHTKAGRATVHRIVLGVEGKRFHITTSLIKPKA